MLTSIKYLHISPSNVAKFICLFLFPGRPLRIKLQLTTRTFTLNSVSAFILTDTSVITAEIAISAIVNRNEISILGN